MHSAVDVLIRLCFNLIVETDVYIALGTNVGDRELNLLRAVAEVGRLPNCKVTGLSPFYETSPLGITDQPAFFNAVLRLSTTKTPQELLHCLQKIENEVFARTRSVRWGPRTMDLDLLLFGDQIISTDELTVPHPRMAERRFVLQPLCMLAPDVIHPVLGKSLKELLAELSDTETVVQI